MWLTLIAIVVVVIVVAFFTLNKEKEEPFVSSIDDRDWTPYIEQYRYIPNLTSTS